MNVSAVTKVTHRSQPGCAAVQRPGRRPLAAAAAFAKRAAVWHSLGRSVWVRRAELVLAGAWRVAAAARGTTAHAMRMWMKRQVRARALIAIMLAVAVATAVIGFSVMYHAAVDVERQRLAVSAGREARWLESMVRFEREEHLGDRQEAEREALTLFLDAHRRFQLHGATQETVLARREGDQIAFLMRHGRGSMQADDRLPFDGVLAQPMFRALQGLSGTMIGLDHDGVRVVAAYEPVEALDLGIVTKVDMAEVRAPFIRAGLLAAGVLVGLLAAGVWLSVSIMRPTIRELEEHARDLERLVEALGASEERYRAIVHQQTEFVARFLPDGTLTFVNDALCRYSGRERPELLGRSLWDFMSDEMRRKSAAHLETLTSDHPAGKNEITWTAADGRTRWVSFVNHALFDDQARLIEYQSVGRDVTDRHEHEAKLERALAQREILLKEIHHRVKNNMAVISSLLSLHERDIEDPMAREVFRAMRGRIRTMSLVHEQLYRSGDFERVDLGRYIDQVVRTLVQSQDDASGRITVRREISEVTLDLERAIPCGLILTELLSNALKHAFPTGRSGTVLVSLREGASGEVELAVEDDGVGTAAAERGGFGLHMVELLTHQLGGTVELDVAAGRRVVVRFPARFA